MRINSVLRLLMLFGLQVSAQVNQWVWLKGDTINSAPGVYGTKGVAAVTNKPGARYGATSWTDASGNLWLFGGYGFATTNTTSAVRMNDLWKFNVTTNQWTWVSGSSSGNQPGTYGTKGVSSPTNNPGSRYAATGWTDNAGNLWLFGGEGNSALVIGQLNDLWKYNIASNEWTWVHGTNTVQVNGSYGTQGTGTSTTAPGSRYFSCGAADGNGDFWLFGGIGFCSTGTSGWGVLNDLWKYNIAQNTWTWVRGSNLNDGYTLVSSTVTGVYNPSNTPGSRSGSVMMTDNAGNVWLYGGTGTGYYYNDLWKVDVSTGQWARMYNASSTANYGSYQVPSYSVTPGSLSSPIAWIDNNNNIHVFGGAVLANTSNESNTMFRYSISSGAWARMKGPAFVNQSGLYGTQGTGTPFTRPGGRNCAVSWRDSQGDVYIFGGNGLSTYTFSSFLNDLWKISPCSLVVSAPVVTNSVVNICSGQSVTLSASGSYNVSWYASQAGTVFVAPGLALPVANVTATTIYYAQDSGCAVGLRTPVTINVSTPSITIVSQPTLCAGASLTLTAQGAATYTWNTNATGPTIVVSPTANIQYSVSGTNSVNCTANQTTTVTVFPIPTIGVQGGTICAGNIFTINPTGAASYVYSGGSSTVSPPSSAVYSVSGTSSAGCVSATQATLSVTVYTLPVVSAAGGSICAGGVFTIIPFGGSTYSYSSGSSTVQPAVTSTYAVTGISGQGCSATSPVIVSVTVHSLPVVTAPSGTICAGNVFTINPAGAASYVYSGGSATVSPLSNAIYSVSGTSSAGCVSAAQATLSVTVFTLPVVSAASGSVCSGSVFTIVPSGAATYSYSSGSSTVQPAVTSTYAVTGISGQGCPAANPVVVSVTVYSVPVITAPSGTICAGDSFTIVPAGAASYAITGNSFVVTPPVSSAYQLTGLSPNGCASASPATVNVTVKPLPTVTAPSGSICTGSAFTISPTGAATYTITGNSFTVAPNQTTSYSVTGTSTNGCVSAATTLTVVVVPLPSVGITGPATVCPGGTFQLSASGASTYSWNSGASTAVIIASVSAGSVFSVTGDSGGCINTASVSVSVFPAPIITLASASQTICLGNTTTLTANGGLSYTWSPYGTSNPLPVTPANTTTYSVTGKDVNGCTAQSSMAIVVAACTGVPLRDLVELTLYYMPSDESLHVAAPVNSEFVLYDLNGCVLFQQKIDEQVQSFRLHLSEGAYIAAINGLRGTKAVKFIVRY